MDNSTSTTSAEQLLREVHSESLQQLLASVRHETKPPSLTCIPTLDSSLSDPSTKSRGSFFNCGDVFEIQGHLGTGKTHLLYFLLATCILPIEHHSCFLGGWKKAAFVFDMDGYFHIARFRHILINRLQQCLPPLTIASLVEKCLQRLHVFRPISSDQLAVSLAHLPKYQAKHFPGVELGMVAINSIDAFYWLDRFKAEHMRPAPASGRTVTYQNTSSILQNIRLSYGATVVMTHCELPQRRQWISASTTNILPDATTGHPSISTNPQTINILSPTTDVSTIHLISLALVSDADVSRKSHVLEIQAVARTLGHPDSSVFKFDISRNGVVMK